MFCITYKIHEVYYSHAMYAIYLASAGTYLGPLKLLVYSLLAVVYREPWLFLD